MRRLHLFLPCLALCVAGCDTKAKEQLRRLAGADSLRTDSIVAIKNDLLSEVMTSTQFVNDVNLEMAKLKARTPAKLAWNERSETDAASMKAERAAVVSRIGELVARLDSSQVRVNSLRARATRLSRQDSSLVAQVGAFEKTIATLRSTAEQDKAEYEAVIARQNAQIAVLHSTVDTVTKDNARLTGETTALIDTVSTLTAEKNAAYYVIGTKDELVKQGVLVEEGRKRFLVLGGRTVAPARELDTAKFTRIDRLRDRTIRFPAGDYTIFTRQSPSFASPFSVKDGKFSGGLRIEQPERFWEPSKFLIII
ncbi:MAG TPA: hypothetical protein VII52_12325, partial [Gemmatimonadaceae bacterium]